MGARRLDLHGERFGHLVAERAVRQGTVLGWRCRCDCGARTWAATGKLTSGHKRSCGCRRMVGAPWWPNRPVPVQVPPTYIELESE